MDVGIEMLVLENIYKKYGEGENETIALNHVNLKVARGSIFGIIGASGAGKSSLIRCANLLEKPTSGKVWINSIDITNFKPCQLSKIRQRIGMIFQNFNLLSQKNVYDNVSFPLKLLGFSKRTIQIKVSPLIDLVGLSERVKSYPSELSGGEQQRVAIARALASDPDLLLSDEATSALDPQTTRNVLQLLKRINSELGITILLITHEMSVIQTICDEAAVMSRGSLVEQQSVEKLFLAPRTAEAKALVQTVVGEEDAILLAKNTMESFSRNDALVLRLTFLGEQAGQPLITRVARQFSIDFVILRADIELVHDKPLGFLIVQIHGESMAIDSALVFLREHVGVEVIENAN